MASAQRNVDFIIEQMAEARDVSARKMFGEYGIYCRGKLIALFCDDQLFIKPTAAGRSFLGTPKEAPPYPGAKPYFLISGDHCEDGEWLSELARITERELPAPSRSGRSPRSSTARAKRASAEGAVKPLPKRAAKRPSKTAKTARKASTKLDKTTTAKPSANAPARTRKRVAKKRASAATKPR